MKFSVLQENLSQALNYVLRAVSTRPGLPVLSNVLIEVIDNKVKFSTTDLELGIINWLPAEVELPGSITVSARTLADFINSIGPGKIDVALEGNILRVKNINSNANFNTIPADEFPDIPHEVGELLLEIPAVDFTEAVNRVAFATATEDTRPILTGILVEADEDGVALIGVDGFRLSKYNLDNVKAKNKFTEVVPAKAFAEVAKIASGTKNEMVQIYKLKGNNQILLRYKDIDFVSRLLEGEFPDYRQIMPSSNVLSFNLSKEELLSAIKIITIFARDIVGNKTILEIDTLNMKMKLSANLAEVGGNEVSIDINEVKGTDVQLAFSAKYLSDMINSIKGDTLSFETNGVTSPGVFHEQGNENYVHIIMPMRIE